MRGKLKEKLRKMKKIKASMIKRLLRVSSQFCQFNFRALSILSYSCTLREFLENSSIGEKKKKEGQARKA